MVVLNSQCWDVEVRRCGPYSPMVDWLEQDLASSPMPCTLAYWHNPLFSSGYHGNDPWMKPAWEALYAADAEVVLNGHDHDYERFAPQSPSGAADDARGIRQFVVGTGGRELRPFRTTIEANSEVRNANTFGVLKLTLYPNSYEWKFVPVRARASPTPARATATRASSRAYSPEYVEGKFSEVRWCLRARAVLSWVLLYGSSPHLGLAKVTLSGAFLKQRSSSSLLKTGWFAAK